MNDLEQLHPNANSHALSQSLQEKALIGGNIADLTPSERLNYYGAICESLGLNPITRPFEYIVLNGKLTLYARKDCTEQLRNLRELSIKIISRELVDGIFIVTAQATNAKGRSDESIGAVSIANLNGEQKANAIMKAETKAKRRVTLSFCGLGMLDESEIENTPDARIESPRNIPSDKGAAVLDKMKRNASSPSSDHQQPESSMPDDVPSLPSPASVMTLANAQQQLRLCEMVTEAASIMNQWTSEEHTQEDNIAMRRTFEETKMRLAKKMKGRS